MTEIPKNYNGKKHLPVPSGKYVVGCTDLMIGQTVTDGCFLRLYFPSQLKDVYENSSNWASWIPHPKYIEGYTNVLGIMPFIGRKLLGWAFGNIWIPTVVDASPCNEQNFPVIVFSHGLTGCRTAYSVFCSELCSHGYIVAAIEHRDETACISYNLVKDTKKEGYIQDWILYKVMEFEKEDMPLRQEQLQQRIRECKRTLDTLFKLNEGTAIDDIVHSTIDLAKFKNMMDFSNPVIAGHSFGSATVLRTLAVEKRFKVGVALDAWMWPLKDEKELQKEIEQPILFINMEAFQTANNLKAMKRFVVGNHADRTERRVVTLKGSVHKNQVDLPFLLPPYLRRLAGAGSKIDPHLAMDLNNRIVLLYLCKHLGHNFNELHSQFVEKHKDTIYEGIPDQA